MPLAVAFDWTAGRYCWYESRERIYIVGFYIFSCVGNLAQGRLARAVGLSLCVPRGRRGWHVCGLRVGSGGIAIFYLAVIACMGCRVVAIAESGILSGIHS